MLPTRSPSSQDLLVVLYQKQMQSNFTQTNPLAQLLRLNLQANMLKLAGQDAPTTSNLDPNLLQLLLTSNLGGQLMNSNKQTSKLPNIDLSSLLSLNKTSQKTSPGRLEANEQPKNKLLAIKQDSPLSVNFSNNISKPITIPAFKEVEDQNNEIEDFEGSDKETIEGLSAKSKKIKKTNMCGHPERGHYAKNMCNPCYHKYGRTKKPWRCSHDKLYAHGLCQNCYINAYNKKRNDKVKEKKDVTSTFSGNELDTDLPTSIHSSDEPLTMEDKAAFADLDVQQNDKIQPENSQNN